MMNNRQAKKLLYFKKSDTDMKICPKKKGFVLFWSLYWIAET